MDDWYYVTQRQLDSFRGSSFFLQKHGGLISMLAKFYPGCCHFQCDNLSTEHVWETKKLVFSCKSQGFLHKGMELLLTDRNMTIVTEYKHPELIRKNTQEIELDVFVPGLDLALEYQVKTFS